MRAHPPIEVVVVFPEKEEDRLALAKRVADVHADCVIGAIQALNCPTGQKLALLQAVIDSVQSRSTPGRHPASQQ